MADSAKGNTDYARGANGRATIPGGAKRVKGILKQRLTTLLPTLAAILLVSLFVSLGQWQWNKASVKGSLQTLLDERNAQPPVHIPGTMVEPQTFRYRHVMAAGRYEPERQILIDNRIHREQAGYHVMTPLRLEGSEMRVLVNRGWIPALPEHSQIPQVDTPEGLVEISGMAIIPGKRFFTLGGEADSTAWQRVWQNLDLQRYSQLLGVPLQPIVVQLAPDNGSGGFMREWPRPDDRLEKHLGYALQWWGFAATTVAIWLFVTFKRKKPRHD